jgi:spoIIIJ-associated protein
MKEVEISAKTVEEAIQQALEELGVSRNEVEVDVLSEGRHGVLGMGAEEARVRVRIPEALPSETGVETTHQDDLINITRDVLETILPKMGITATVVHQEEAVIQEQEKTPAPVVFNIEGDGLGILIGRRGQTLVCLQYIVRLIVSHQMKASAFIVIDVNGYKQHRYQSLKALANRIAEEVEASGEFFALEPMPAYERRIIHIALADHASVTTESTGIGEARKVVILPKEQ